LRYLYHAHLILTHLKSSSLTDIVEIGGGYGGLYLAIDFLYTKYDVEIKSYSIIDLEIATNLQKKYISNFNTKIPVFFYKSQLFGADIDKKDLFLISNYCFSEINMDLQKKYVEILFNKVVHGFMCWNFIPVYDFGFSTTIESENVPYSSNSLTNKFVRF
jgi:SAM-dependent MidA family methyltransferase